MVMKASVPLILIGGLFAATLAACGGDDADGTNSTGDNSGGSGGGGGAGGGGGPPAWDLDALTAGLEEANRRDYEGRGDGGLTHTTYWTLSQSGPEFMSLPAGEQDKVKKIQAGATGLASQLVQQGAMIAGTEVTGTLVQGAMGERRQRVVLKLPAQWNGKLIVAGTPGTRNEFASEVVFASWLVAEGYAFVSGDKGLPNDLESFFTGTHPTQHWGEMMIDLGLWARERIEAATSQKVAHVYAAGLSNGGYQVRRGLEIDHLRVTGGDTRLFEGGLEWAGVYWPDERVLDADQNGAVTPAEFAAADHIVSSCDRAALALGWAYDPATLTTPEAYTETPPYAAAHPAMTDAGFSAESAVLWGAYNTLFDALKATLPKFQGVGYFNLTAYIYRAELLGHTTAESAAYSCYVSQPDQAPPLYDYLAGAEDGGWTPESVGWALKNANTGEFSAPLISVHGDGDALVGLVANGAGYRAAVEAYGDPALHRLYVITGGPHIDRHADGALDYDFDAQLGEEGAADLLTPVQGYARRAFGYLSAWVEAGATPPDSKTVVTDPANDVIDPGQIEL